MKRKIMMAITSIVLSVAMITPAFADELIIDEEIVIENDETVIEEDLADEELIDGEWVTYEEVEAMDEEIVAETEDVTVEVIDDEIIEDGTTEEIIEEVVAEDVIAEDGTVSVVNEEGAAVAIGEELDINDIISANGISSEYAYLVADNSDEDDIEPCDGGQYPSTWFCNSNFSGVVTSVSMEKYKASKLYAYMYPTNYYSQEGYIAIIYDPAGNPVAGAEKSWYTKNVSKTNITLTWDNRRCPAGRYKAYIYPKYYTGGKWYVYETYKDYMWIDVKPDVTDTKVVTMPETKGKWVKSGTKWKFKLSSGSYAKSKWICVNSKFYYLDGNGYMTTGWYKVGTKWYYFNSNGVMQKDWIKLNNKWYYLNPNGVMLTGWQKIVGDYYYFNGNGVMQKGWIKINGKDYYLYGDGHLAQDEWVGKYYVNINGVWTKTK